MQELLPAGCALTFALEMSPGYEPKVDVYEAPEGVLNVVIRTIDDDELEGLTEIPRAAPKRAH